MRSRVVLVLSGLLVPLHAKTVPGIAADPEEFQRVDPVPVERANLLQREQERIHKLATHVTTHCAVDRWMSWSGCTLSCDGGKHSRERQILVEPTWDGYACPALREQEICNEARCPVDCDMAPWNEWTSCSVSCGTESGSQRRHRNVRVEDAFGGIPCPHIDEEALCAVEPCIATPAITLAESIWIMRDDLEGWTTWTQSGTCTPLYWESKRLMGGDPGSHDREDMWYFVAPSSFIGDKLEALDGSLTFSIGFDAFNDNGKPLIRGWDVILESTLRRLKVQLGVGDLVLPGYQETQITVRFNTESPWRHIRNGQPASRIDLIAVLRSVSALYIRGSYYNGHEIVFLQRPTMKTIVGTNLRNLSTFSTIELINHWQEISLYNRDLAIGGS